MQTYENEANKGHETPLDFYPEIDRTQAWFKVTYARLRALNSSMNGNMNIVDIHSYFTIYPLAFDLIFITDVLVIIDSKLRDFDKKEADAKEEDKKTKTK